jgi:Co/Zn/Cd efflux system component
MAPDLFRALRHYAHQAAPCFFPLLMPLGDLGAFTSAIVLAMIALFIGYESIDRLFHPVSIAFNQAIPIAGLGLGINLLSAFLLRDDHDHHHAHSHEHDHDDDESDHAHEHRQRGDYHRDHNLRAAFVHVMADAAVSVLVITGLVFHRRTIGKATNRLQWS